jgi:hypothetical protein
VSCARLASAMCTRREECATPTDTNARYAGEADCRARTELACTEWAKLPGAALAPAAIESCAETIRAAPCSDIGTLYYSATGHHPYCLPSGTHPDGGACVNDAQCASRNCGGATCGTCTTPAEWLDDYAYEGEPCDATTNCQSFLTCEAGTCTQAICATPGCLDYGHHCTGISDPEPRDCPLGTHCVGQSDMGNGRCEPYAPDGTECDPYYGPPCQYPATCHRDRCTLPTDIGCGLEAPPK